jgi:hypothetical protein
MKKIISNISLLFLLFSCAACFPSEQHEFRLFNKHFQGSVPASLIPIASFEGMDPDLTYIVYFRISPSDLEQMIKSESFHKIPMVADTAFRNALEQLRNKHPGLKGDFKKAIYQSDKGDFQYLIYLVTDEKDADCAIFVKFGT